MNEATFKIILIGDSGSGKSCLLARFIRDYFAQDYSVTVGSIWAIQVWTSPPRPSPSMRTIA